MVANRIAADVQLRGDGTGGKPAKKELQNFQFPACERRKPVCGPPVWPVARTSIFNRFVVLVAEQALQPQRLLD